MYPHPAAEHLAHAHAMLTPHAAGQVARRAGLAVAGMAIVGGALAGCGGGSHSPACPHGEHSVTQYQMGTIPGPNNTVIPQEMPVGSKCVPGR